MKEVNKRINAKKIILSIKDFIIKNKHIILMCLPFIVMDLATRILGGNINYFKIYRFVPNFFTAIWIYLFIGLTLSCKKSFSKFIYLFFDILFIIMFLINNVYYSITSNFFSFNLLESVSEGSPYFMDSLKNCNILVYIFLIIIIILSIIGFKNIPNTKYNKHQLLKILIVFIALHTITPFFLGKANTDLVWSTWKNPRNVYNLYNDSNKSLRVSGFYEYTFRNFYITYLKPQNEDNSDKEFLLTAYKDETTTTNKYTGKFNGKNLIFLQLEGIDNWLLNETDTPTLYNMMENSINFSNHYSFYTGGGSTFNSEFAVNTGFISPLSYNQNAYTFNQNNFPYSMAKLFKEENYQVNAFHMNYGEYYSRSINYKNWGYDNYYGLLDMYKYNDDKYKLDRELIENTEFSDLMFPNDSNFVDYIITYSSHMPFTNTKGVCKQLYNMDNPDLKEADFKEMSEEECARRQVKEADYMVELLLKKLQEKGLIDNTVIVVFTDHYLYTLEDQSIISKYKETDNNLINQTPFFIWSNGSINTTVKKVNSQLNILPTVLNLFGIKYNTNNYIGADILDNSYSGLVFFSDYSWYDGNVYVDGGEVTNGKYISTDNLNNNNYSINYLAKKNDLTLKYNYFKKTSNKK